MKKYFILLLTISLNIFFCSTFAQSIAYFKLTENGTLNKIIHLNSGGYVTIGYNSTYKIHIIKWSESFDPIWKFVLDDSHIINIEPKIVESQNGNIYLMGTTSENSGSTLIIKFNSSGTILWQKNYYANGGNLNSYALSRASGDDGFIFGGGQCVLSNYIVKCDQNGAVEWQKQYIYPLSTGVTVCNSIINDGSNYIVSSGYNVNSILTFKIDNAGTVLSEKAYTYAAMQIIPTKIMKLNNTGGYAILGNYNSTNDNKTQFVAILNSDLTINSFNELTVTYTQFRLNDMAVINNGANLILNGSIYDGSAFYIALMNLQSNGTIVWKKLAEGNSSLANKNVEFAGLTALGNFTVNMGYGYNEGAVAAIIDASGNGLCNDIVFNITNVPKTLALQTSAIVPITSSVLSAGVSYSYSTTLPTTKYVYCGELPNAIADNENTFSDVKVYPNPADDIIYLKNLTENTSVKIFSPDGKLMFETSGNQKNGINTTALKSGLYILQLTDNNNMKYIKVHILH